MSYGTLWTCDICGLTHKKDRWNTQKAQNAGWFMSFETGKAYCPEHVPDWVAGWRAKKLIEEIID